MATDGVGRTLPGYSDVGALKANKYVGVFYWLWHAYVRTNPILDVTKELQRTNGNPAWVFQDYYWSEPENGYYHNSDPWVARRHLQMLANAGVDFIYIDFTNGTQGSDSFDAFMAVAMDMYNQGIPVPKLVFFLNDDVAGGPGRHVIDYIYNNIYSVGKYNALWFYWNGKPLVMSAPNKANSTAEANFFTFRDTWAFQSGTTDQWRFIDDYPQHPSYHNGIAEQICVNKSMGAPLVQKTAVNNKGASYTTTGGTPAYDQFFLCSRTPYGDYFEQQWGQAHAVNPSIVCITGWNELTAGAWNFDAGTAAAYNFMGKPCDQDPGHWYFVDEFNAEFNRDLEPMNDANTDNYYYQMVSHIRKYKGMQAPNATSPAKTILIDGNFSEWSNVTPVFVDPVGDVLARNFKNVNNSATLTNNTNRNDIIESRVTNDANNIYFYVKCNANITSYTGNNWMLLYVNTDRNQNTGWQGYDYVINMGVNSATQTTVKKWNGSSWAGVGTASFNVNGTQMEISVSKSLMALPSNPSVYFHWNDNPQLLNDIKQFFINGESAPDRRFDYSFNSSSSTIQSSYPGPSPTNIPGTIEAENYDNGGEGIAYHDVDVANKGAMYRNDGVDIENCAEGGFNISYGETSEWLEYTVNVVATGSYKIDTRIATINTGGSFHIEFDGTNVSGALAVPNTAGWQNWQTVSTTVNLVAGQHVMRMYIDQGGFNINKFTVTGGLVLSTIYKIVSKNSNKCLDVNGGSLIDGGNVQQWTDNGTPSQQWKLEDAGSGYYKLTAQCSGKCLEVSGFSLIDGGNIQQWGYLAGDNQKWSITDIGGGYYKIIGKQSGKCVEVAGVSIADGANVQQWGYLGAANQQWQFIQVGALKSAAIATDVANMGKENLNIYPNPAQNLVTINIGGATVGPVNVAIYDLSGKLLLNRTNESNSKFTINTTDLRQGVYTLKIVSANLNVTQKLVIAR